MKWHNVFLAGALVVSGVACAPDGDEAKETQSERPTGIWQLESEIDDGESLPAVSVRTTKLIFEDKKLTFQFAGEKVIADVEFDTDRKPPRLAWTYRAPQAGKKQRAIYRLAKDALTICFHRDGKEPPKEFAAEKESGRMLMVFRRWDKAPDQSPELARADEEEARALSRKKCLQDIEDAVKQLKAGKLRPEQEKKLLDQLRLAVGMLGEPPDPAELDADPPLPGRNNAPPLNRTIPAPKPVREPQPPPR
jgi:uncharacterized protein (TIGR03067 family)